MKAFIAATLIVSFRYVDVASTNACAARVQHAAYRAGAVTPCCRIGQGCAHFLSTDAILRGSARQKT